MSTDKDKDKPEQRRHQTFRRLPDFREGTVLRGCQTLCGRAPERFWREPVHMGFGLVLLEPRRRAGEAPDENRPS